METLFIPLSLLAGGLLTVQAGANGPLAKAVASRLLEKLMSARAAA